MYDITLYNKIFGFIDLNTLMTGLISSVIIFAVFFILSLILIKESHLITAKIFKAKTENGRKAVHDSIVKPFGMWLMATGIFFAIKAIPFSTEIMVSLWPIMLKIYRMFLFAIICIGMVNLIDNLFILSPKIAENADKTAYSFFTKLVKTLIIAITVIIFLTELNFDVSSIIASLGIGGVVLALAAQDTASNFFSGLVILFDKPFEIGDWISVSGMEGIVEDMKFRSCRIRTFDNALISVPNSKLSSDSVTNWAKMELRKTKITFSLTYFTNKKSLHSICEEIKANLSDNKNIKTDSIIVYFDKFNTSSLDIAVQYNTYLTSFKDYVKLKEDVQYMIMEVVEKHNCRFALDTKIIHVENRQ